MTLQLTPVAKWRTQAECRSAPSALFYPMIHPVTGRDVNDYSRARSFCIACPVRCACLDEALRERDFEGVRAGLVPKQLISLANRITS